MEGIDISALLFICGLLTLGTNVITQVLKKTFAKIPPQITALTVSVVLTVAAFLAWAAVGGITVQWYMIAGAVVMGFFVSYAAQFGFDKLKELINKYTGGSL